MTEARAETGVPLAPDRTDRVRATPPAVPFVVGVEERVGVRFAAAGEDEETLEGVLRPGVPVAGGLFAVAVDMMYVVCGIVYREIVANSVQKDDQRARVNLQRRPTGDRRGCGAWLAALASYKSGTLAFTVRRRD